MGSREALRARLGVAEFEARELREVDLGRAISHFEKGIDALSGVDGLLEATNAFEGRPAKGHGAKDKVVGLGEIESERKALWGKGMPRRVGTLDRRSADDDVGRGVFFISRAREF